MQIEGWDGKIGGSAWWGRMLAFALVTGVLLALLGPFGSYYNAVSLRLIDWPIIMVAGAILFGLCMPPLLRFGTSLGLPRPLVLGCAVIVVTMPASAIAAFVSKTFWGRWVSDWRWIDWYGQTLLIAVGATLLWVLLEIALGSRRTIEDDDPIATIQPTTGDILCLQMEDNYVRVHREAGSSLELMPLHEAIRRYGKGRGLQVHRSWWVATDAVERAERDARLWRLRLRNGLVVPIARNRVSQVRAQGWRGLE